MNPYLLKILVMFVLVISFTLVFLVFFLFYKHILRPLFIKLFNYKKVLYTAQFIIKSEIENKDKVEDLIKANITDTDLIKIAEEEIKKANSKKINVSKDKALIFSIKNIFKRDKIEQKKEFQPTTTKSKSGDSNTTGTERELTNRPENAKSNNKSNIGSTEYGDFPAQSSRRVTGTKKYFT